MTALNGILVLVNDGVGVLLQALSNQKYREMYEQFKDVGLMTGDVTINPSASCIVMTTEVSMEEEDEGLDNWNVCYINLYLTLCCLASFPGPAQLFVACSTEKRREPGIFSHVSMT